MTGGMAKYWIIPRMGDKELPRVGYEGTGWLFGGDLKVASSILTHSSFLVRRVALSG